MISSEVQRTLVKSPPELWAELSDPAALARHLGALGEIRITRVEPEQKVEWEAGETSGTVSIKPSGWGTKVKLTVTRELAEPEPPAAVEPEPPAAVEPEPAVAPESPTAIGPEDDAHAGVESPLEPRPFTIPLTAAGSALVRGSHPRFAPDAAEVDAEPESASEPEPEHQPEPDPTPRRGLFARLFGRRRAAQPEQEPSEETQREGDVATDEPAREPYNALAVWAPSIESEPEPEAEAEPRSEPEATAGAEPQQPAGQHVPPAEQPTDLDEPTQPEANSDLSAEIRAAEEGAAEEVEAVLTGVLDRLGEAHHRPFSRS